MGRGKGGFFSGYTCVKFLFFGFNVIFWLLGCAILGIGIWLHISKGNYASVAPSFNFLSATALCIAAGGIVLVVGFFGCCGAIMENPCMLLTYFLLVVIIFVMEIVAGILAFVFRNEVETVLKNELLLGVREKYNTSSEQGLRDAWDSVQRNLKCCGVESYEDWYRISSWRKENRVPDSCCIEEIPNCGTHNADPNIWHQQGCFKELKFWLRGSFSSKGFFSSGYQVGSNGFLERGYGSVGPIVASPFGASLGVVIGEG